MQTLISVPLFSVPVCISSEVYNMSSVEFNFIKNLKKIKNIKNFITENRYILNFPELSNLKKWIQKNIDIYFFEFLKIKDVDEIYITQSWSNITQYKQSHQYHKHANSVISGVMHFDDDDAKLNFFSNKNIFPLDFNYKERTMYNSERWSWPTKKYSLFLFPSTLNHSVDTQEINRDRISLSFNTWVRGTVGNESSSTLLQIK
tara:strand:+ start:39 stop:647 length:609 start_codon:yes stop_codon:yes gene_type:complete